MLGSHRAPTRDERAVFGRGGVEPAAAGGCACVPAAIVLGVADGDEALAEGGAKVLAARIELGRARGGWGCGGSHRLTRLQHFAVRRWRSSCWENPRIPSVPLHVAMTAFTVQLYVYS